MNFFVNWLFFIFVVIIIVVVIVIGFMDVIGLYMFIYFWGFLVVDFSLFMMVGFVGIVLGFVFVFWLIRRYDRKLVGFLVMVIVSFIMLIFIVLKMFGMLFNNGDLFILVILGLSFIVLVFVVVIMVIIFVLMIVDIVDVNELRIGWC